MRGNKKEKMGVGMLRAMLVIVAAGLGILLAAGILAAVLVAVACVTGRRCARCGKNEVRLTSERERMCRACGCVVSEGRAK